MDSIIIAPRRSVDGACREWCLRIARQHVYRETAVTQHLLWPLPSPSPSPSPWTEAVDFLDLGPRASKKVEHWRARLLRKTEKIDNLWTGRGIGMDTETELKNFINFGASLNGFAKLQEWGRLRSSSSF